MFIINQHTATFANQKDLLLCKTCAVQKRKIDWLPVGNVKGTQSTDLLPLTIVNGSKLSVSSLFPYENGQSIFTGTLDPAETLAVLVNTFLLDDQLRLKIDNSEQVNFFLADTAGGINSKGVLLNSPAEITITAAAFGDIDLATHRFLTAVNSSSVVTHYRVQLD